MVDVIIIAQTFEIMEKKVAIRKTVIREEKMT